MPIAWQEAHVATHKEWAPGLKTLRLEETDPPVSFRAGQFVNLALDLPGGRVSRSYSMASAPGAPLEFFLVEVEGGALSAGLFALRPGDPILVNPLPAGQFTLDKVPPAEVLWLFATGTGLGPYVSMLRTDEPWDRFERLVLVHGVRRPEHLAYRDELAARSAEHGERLTVVSLVSRGEPPAGALAGRFTAALGDGRLEAAADVALHRDTSQVLLCGNPEMIAEMRDLLGARGLKRNRRRAPGHVTAEKYWD